MKKNCEMTCAQCGEDAFLSAYKQVIRKRTTCRKYRRRRWTRRRYCVRWNYKTVGATPSVVYSEISGDNIRRASKCTCNKENCEEKNYCASIRYRRVGSPDLSLSTSNMSVCLKNTDFQHGMSEECDQSNTKHLEDRNVDNQWHTAKFSFMAKCDDLEVKISVMKGLDGFHLDNATLHIGECQAVNSNGKGGDATQNLFDMKYRKPITTLSKSSDENMSYHTNFKELDAKRIQGKVEQLTGELKSLTDQLDELDKLAL